MFLVLFYLNYDYDIHSLFLRQMHYPCMTSAVVSEPEWDNLTEVCCHLEHHTGAFVNHFYFLL